MRGDGLAVDVACAGRRVVINLWAHCAPYDRAAHGLWFITDWSGPAVLVDSASGPERAAARSRLADSGVLVADAAGMTAAGVAAAAGS